MSARDFGECADCKFWQRNDEDVFDEQRARLGQCRRRSPRYTQAVDENSAYRDFAITHEGDWCGEFESSK